MPTLAEPAAYQHGRYLEIASEAQILFGRLSEVNREILSRRIQWGLTFAEIGTALGLGSDQVKAPTGGHWIH